MVVVVSAAIEEEPSVSVGAAGLVTAGVTLRFTELGAEVPPLLLQVSVKVSTPTTVGVIFSLPPVGSVPDHAPEAVHRVARPEDQEIVVDSPTATVGDSSRSVGANGGSPEVAVSVTELAAELPSPFVQVSV